MDLGRRSLVLAGLLGAGAIAMGAAQPPVLAPASGSPIAVGSSPGNLLVGDVNEDGRPDLLVASAPIRQIAVLLGQGDGRFAARAGGPLDVPEPPTEMAAGDINRDGHLDLAIGSHDSYRVLLLLGDGRGAFAAAPGSPLAMKEGKQPHTHGLEIADFNNDGHPDLATVNSNDDNDVSVMLGDGMGGFRPAPRSPFPVGPAPYPMAVGDLNADGIRDIVVSSTGLTAPSVGLTALFGTGGGSFKRADIPSKQSRTWFVALADVNADKTVDILATHTEDDILTVLLGRGRSGFQEAAGSPFSIGSNAWCIRTGDVNRDGRLDVIAAASTGVRVLLGDGRGGFAAAPGSPFATGAGTWKVAVADLNGDGRLDAATSNLESNTVSVFLGR